MRTNRLWKRMVKGTKVKVAAPVMNIPTGDGKETPVIMDLHMWSDMMNYITDKKLKMIHCKMEDSNVILEFTDKLEATKFVLGYAEIHGKAKPEIF